MPVTATGIFVLHDGMGLVAKRLEHIPNSDPPRVGSSPTIRSTNPTKAAVKRSTLLDGYAGSRARCDLATRGLIERDMQIRQFLKEMEAIGVLDNTIIVYSTDNGPQHGAGLHGGTTPFRGEKMVLCAAQMRSGI